MIRITKGKRPKALFDAPGPGLVPYLDLSAVENGSMRQWADASDAKLVDAGSLVMVWDGARSGWSGLTQFKGALGSTLALIESPLEKRFLRTFLKAHFEDINRNNRGSGIPHVDPGYLKALAVPILPEEAQLRVADRVEVTTASALAAQDHLARAQRALERFRQSILAAACSGRLTAEWRRRHQAVDVRSLVSDLGRLKAGASSPRSRGISPIAESVLPDIPKSWTWMSVDSITSAVVDGVHKTPDYVASGIPFVTVRNLTAGPGIEFERVKYISKADHEAFTCRTRPERGDILVSKDGTLGVIRQVDTDRAFSIFVSVAMIKPLLYEMSDYLVLALSSPQVQRQMVGVGSGLVHLVLRDLKADGVPMPPLDEQLEIVTRVRQLTRIADAIEQRIAGVASNVQHATANVLANAFKAATTTNEDEQ